MDTSQCGSRPGSCGNGILEADYEECDGPTSCADYAKQVLVRRGYPPDFYVGGTISCLPRTCQVGPSSSCIEKKHCGNGILEPEYFESCDGKDFGGKTCQSFGFSFGELRCGADCRVSATAACSGGCLAGFRTMYCQ